MVLHVLADVTGTGRHTVTTALNRCSAYLVLAEWSLRSALTARRNGEEAQQGKACSSADAR